MSLHKVCVLVTFYNQEQYVDRALQSIINQKTEFDVRIIVGDDGSSDQTCAKVNQWIKDYPDRIALHVMDRCGGPQIAGFRASRNRLNLLKYVDSDYFIFLDGDDYFDCQEKLQKQVDILDDESNLDCVACGHNIDMLYQNGERRPLNGPEIKTGKYTPEKYWNSLYFHTDTLLIRSSVIPLIDTHLLENNFNDNMITFSVIQAGNIYYFSDSWAVYVQTGDGIWTSGKVVVNYIRNMFLYDLCNLINPKMKKENKRRFMGTWKELYKLRKQINFNELELLYADAADKNLINTCEWINYNNLNLWKKQKMCIKAVHRCWKLVIKEKMSKVYKILKKKNAGNNC